MELGFAVSAGPLTQVSVQLSSIETAVHLATGAFGWWKARERSQSLLEVIESGGAQLVSTSSFNQATYRAVRDHGEIRAVAVQSGRLQAAILPKASTAVPNNGPLTCLRALVAGLLCFYDVEPTTRIIARVLPSSLLQFDQEGIDFKVDGPNLASLRAFVSAVAVEEDNNTFRQYIFERVDSLRKSFTGAELEEIVKCESAESCESHLVIGLVRWMLMPAHRREHSTYYTRSLIVWLVGAALTRLGFEIHPSLQIIATAEDYETSKSETMTAGYGRIYLCTSTHVTTDPLMMDQEQRSEEERLRPRLGPIRAVPWILFRRDAGIPGRINTDYLAEVWRTSYSLGYNRTASFSYSLDSKCAIRLNLPQGRQTHPDFYTELMFAWSPQLLDICGPALEQFVPRFADERTGWVRSKLSDTYDLLAKDPHSSDEVLVRQNCKIMTAIVLGTVYGVASKCVWDGDRPLNLSSEIAIEPDLLYDRKRVYRFGNIIGLGLDGTLSPPLWITFVLGLFAGGNLDDEWNISMLKPLVLGGNLNGMTIISDVAVRPSSDPNNLLRMNIKRGQTLNLPLTHGGLVLASGQKQALLDLVLIPGSQLYVLRHDPSIPCPTSLRIDAEPDWEGNPDETTFRVREQGLVKGRLNLNAVFSSLSDNIVMCACAKYVTELAVPALQGWRQLSLYQIMNAAPGQVKIRDSDRVLVDASSSDHALLMAVGMLQAMDVKISMGCLECTYGKFQGLSRQWGTALIVGKWER